jgi:Bifunctional DNA primase/polymerase, N-terminal
MNEDICLATEGYVGAFRENQPRYAKHGIPTFPVKFEPHDDGKYGKVPCVKHWQRIGQPASNNLAAEKRFRKSDGLGLPVGNRTGLVVYDTDSSDDAVFREVERRFGDAALLARTPSGGWHAYYRHSGEGRHVRPKELDGLPVDILGTGFVVGFNSRAPHGKYELVRGSWEDLKNLPPVHKVLDGFRGQSVAQGVRNQTTFQKLLRQAPYCDDYESLLDVARTINMDCSPPQDDASLQATTKKVWEYQVTGNNWVGRKSRASTDRDELLALSHDPQALNLLLLLRISHPPIGADEPFAIDQVKTAALLHWSRETVRTRITTLMRDGYLKRVHNGKGKGDPHLYRLVR